MTKPVVLKMSALGFPWQTMDPFLFCVHHNDAYPAGNEAMGPAASLAGRRLGMDFGGRDGWSMYHGEVVPGFPRHPHRGFETITIARRGFIDHSDSLGATARFGQGDVQWMTAGSGVMHAEMFPLLRREGGNPVELFQIWLNLPAADKLKDPYFTMFWGEKIPRRVFREGGGPPVEVTVIAGALEGMTPLPPPPSSWASRERAQVAVWTLKMAPGASWTAPPTQPGVNRSVYFFSGEQVLIGEEAVTTGHVAQVRPEAPLPIINGAVEAELLILQGRPIGEPVVQQGPFVMNSAEEIRQTIQEYQRTGFGGWGWTRPDPVHAREQGRFAIHADGRREIPG